MGRSVLLDWEEVDLESSASTVGAAGARINPRSLLLTDVRLFEEAVDLADLKDCEGETEACFWAGCSCTGCSGTTGRADPKSKANGSALALKSSCWGSRVNLGAVFEAKCVSVPAPDSGVFWKRGSFHSKCGVDRP